MVVRQVLRAVVLTAIAAMGVGVSGCLVAGNNDPGAPGSAGASVESGSAREHGVLDSWQHLEGHRLSGLVWSPDGKYIAFVATPIGKTGDEEMMGPKWADIWLLDATVEDSAVRMTRLVHLEADGHNGIPVGLFWICSEQIGWAATGFAFFTMQLDDEEPRPLIPFRCLMPQGRTYGEVTAPDDVYCDTEYNKIVFSAEVNGARNASRHIICTYWLDTNRLLVTPLGTDVGGVVTLCVTPESQNRILYFAAYHLPSLDPSNCEAAIWAVPWFDFTWSEIITRRADSSFLFPRVSADGKRLAWLSCRHAKAPESHIWELVVANLEDDITRFGAPGVLPGRRLSPDHTVIARLPMSWAGTSPGLGCPYCWSPTGHKIAYFDGHSVRVIDAATLRQ